MKGLLLTAALLSLPSAAPAEALAQRVDAYLDAYSSIDQLLRHTSGVGLVEDPALLTGRHSVQDYLAAVAAAPPLFAPGENDEYSSEGYLLLASIVERATGRPFYDYMSATSSSRCNQGAP